MATTEMTKKSFESASPVIGLSQLIESNTNKLKQILPSHLNAERMVRIAHTCIRTNPELSKCTPESFLGSLFVLAQVGLEPIHGRSYLLPFSNKRKVNGEWKTSREVQAVIGYKGLIELFYRHKSALSIDMHTVYENDFFSVSYGSRSEIVHTPVFKNRGPAIAYYAVAKMKEGGEVFKAMSVDEIRDHAAKHSKTYGQDFSPWTKDFNAMAMKTVLIQLAKVLPLSVEIQRAIEIDETSRALGPAKVEPIEIPDQTNWDVDAGNDAIEPPIPEKG